MGQAFVYEVAKPFKCDGEMLAQGTIVDRDKMRNWQGLLASRYLRPVAADEVTSALRGSLGAERSALELLHTRVDQLTAKVKELTEAMANINPDEGSANSPGSEQAPRRATRRRKS